MTIQERVKKCTGIAGLMQENARQTVEMRKITLELERLRDEDLRLRKLVAEKFADLLPASPEFIDEIRKQLECKIDQCILACDRIADAVQRSSRNYK